MLVRSIEFQENFRLVTLEAARQQSVLNRDAIDTAQNEARILAEQRLVDLARATPDTETGSSRVVDGGGGNTANRDRRRSENSGEEQENSASLNKGLPQGKTIDLFA